MTRIRLLVTAALFALLAACSTTSPSSTLTYTKPGIGTAGRQQDENACLRAASGLDNQGFLLPFLPFEIDRSAYGQWSPSAQARISIGSRSSGPIRWRPAVSNLPRSTGRRGQTGHAFPPRHRPSEV
jgi:hypothetical protein